MKLQVTWAKGPQTMIATELENTKLEQPSVMPEQLDQASLLNMIAETGMDASALQQKAEYLIQNPEQFLALLADFETMKAETLTAIVEWWGKVDAAGRERLLAAQEVLKFTKLAIETLAGDLLLAAREAASEGAEIAAGIFAALFRRKRFAFTTVLTIAAFIIISCGKAPAIIKTAVAPDVAYAAEPSTTPSAVPSLPPTKETAQPAPTKKPTKTPVATEPTVKPVTESATPSPESTATDETTATAAASETAAALTPRQQEFLDQGFDKLCSLEDGVTYGILYENSVEYMPEGGVEFGKKGYATSTVEVDFYNPETKQFERKKFVIDWFIPLGTDDGSYINYPIETGSVASAKGVLPRHLIENFRGQYFDSNKGSTPFIKLTFKSTGLGEGFEIVDDFFSDAFPEFKGEITTITIPDIGEVLAVRGALIEGYPNWED